MNTNRVPSAVTLTTTHVDASNSKEGTELLAKLIRERVQFSVAPDDTGWAISYIDHREIEDQPVVA